MKTRTILTGIFVLLLCFRCSAQNTVTFHWTDQNDFPVTFNVCEVSYPDTNTILQQLNLQAIPDNADPLDQSISWVWNYGEGDDQTHYFRVIAIRTLTDTTLYSEFSNVASGVLWIKPQKPLHLFLDW